MKIARIYLRVSTAEQDLGRQEKIKEGAIAAGFYVAGVYREKASGVTFRNRCDESYCGTGLRPPDFANSCDDFSLNSCDGPVRISK